MKKRTIKSITLAITMLLSVGAVQAADNNNELEKEHNEIIESLDAYSREAFLESHGFNTESKIFVYDLEKGLIFSENESDLTKENYKVIFQSDLLMEDSGDRFYIMTTENIENLNN